MVTVVKAHREMAAFPVDVCFVVETPEDRDVFDAALKRAAASES
jgi:hypothetical protein